MAEGEMRGLRGDDVAVIFQEPRTSLNPLFSVGDQIAEAIREHRGTRYSQAWAGAVELLRQVGIADPDLRAHDYPHMMSGGMRQRVMIAMALACEPAVLIADEPTTALDVTIQAQILDLLRALKASKAGMSIIFVTHNMGVVAEMADRGRIVEAGPVREIFASPKPPYTKGLLSSIAKAERGRRAERCKSRSQLSRGMSPARSTCHQAVPFLLAVHSPRKIAGEPFLTSSKSEWVGLHAASTGS